MTAPLECFLAGIPISIIDVRTRRIPDYLSLGTLLVVLLIALVFDTSNLVWAVAGGLLGFAAFWAVNRLTGGELGLGDAKYSAAIGAALGPAGWFWAVLGGSVLALAAAVVLMAARVIDRKTRIPFAPFLAAGTAFSILFAAPLSSLIFGEAAP